jgi:hypothetical protein
MKTRTLKINKSLPSVRRDFPELGTEEISADTHGINKHPRLTGKTDIYAPAPILTQNSASQRETQKSTTAPVRDQHVAPQHGVLHITPAKASPVTPPHNLLGWLMTGTSLQYSSQSCLTGISHILKMKT